MDNRFAEVAHEAASSIPRLYRAAVAGLVFALLTALPTAPISAQPAKDPLPAAKPLGEPLPAPDLSATFRAHFSADGKTVLTARGPLAGQGDWKTPTKARLFNAVTGKPLGPALSFSLKVPGTKAYLLSVLVRLHEKTIVTAIVTTTELRGLPTKSDIQAWDATTGKHIWGPVTVDGWVTAVAFSPEGKTIVTSDPESARLWDAANGKAISDPLLHQFGGRPLVAFSPDGKLLVTGSTTLGGAKAKVDGGEARFWDVATGKPRGDPLPQSGLRVNHVGFSPDGKTFLTSGSIFMMGGKEIEVRVWDAATRKPLGEPLRFRRGPRLALSPDARTVLAATEEKTAQLWDVVTGKTHGEALQHSDMVYHATFSPDGKVLLTVSGSDAAVENKPSEVRLWDVATGKPFCRVPHKGVVVGAVFSPDGTVLLLANQQDARLWQVPKLSK